MRSKPEVNVQTLIAEYALFFAEDWVGELRIESGDCLWT